MIFGQILCKQNQINKCMRVTAWNNVYTLVGSESSHSVSRHPFD